MSERTIAAIATPLGESSIGVIRISGKDALIVADKVFRSFSGKKLNDLDGYSAAYGEIVDGKKVIDDVVALVFRAPKSYTGENVVEFSLHGGRLILKEALRLILQNGAYMAQAGEFTKRAFLNGKCDLTKAESIMGLISANSHAELRLSRAAHIGGVAAKIDKIEADLTAADASIAAFSDYPDEDIEGLDYENFLLMLKNAKSALEDMLSNYDAGRVLREGIETAIVGKPNVGKSTLMNMLSGAERSIVTDVAGTTRDVIEDTVVLGDITLRLADTAGIRSTKDTVEIIGVERAFDRINTAELILAVFDCSQPIDEDDISLLKAVKDKNTIVVVNKTDLDSSIDMSVFNGFRVITVSAKNNTGFEELCRQIAEITGTANFNPDTAVLIGERQRACAHSALVAVNEAIDALTSGHTIDAVGVCVDDALASLFELTGKRVTAEVTDEIFKKFCVGK